MKHRDTFNYIEYYIRTFNRGWMQMNRENGFRALSVVSFWSINICLRQEVTPAQRTRGPEATIACSRGVPIAP